VAGESVAVKVNNLLTYSMYGYSNYVILSKKIVENFSNDEIIALSLYIHGANRKAISTNIALASFRMIISTCAEVLTAYSALLEIQRTGNKAEAFSKLAVFNLIKTVVLGILIERLNISIDIRNGLQFVKSKGYLRQLMNARQKFPSDKAGKIPNVNIDDAATAINFFTKFLDIIKFKDNIDKNNISKPVSYMNKVLSIFKKS